MMEASWAENTSERTTNTGSSFVVFSVEPGYRLEMGRERKMSFPIDNLATRIHDFRGEKTLHKNFIEKTSKKHGHETRIQAGRVFSCFYFMFFINFIFYVFSYKL